MKNSGAHSEFRVRKALVLGERAMEDWIARSLRVRSFEVVSQQLLTQKRLPCLSDPTSLDQIRCLFSEFVQMGEGSLPLQGGGQQNLVHHLVHPGTTLWAERPELPTLAREFGLTVVSPSARILSLLNHKLNFLLEAGKLGIAHGVLSSDPMHSLREIEEFMDRTQQKFPFFLKVVKGGGGFGSWMVQSRQSLQKDLLPWLDQLRKNLGEVLFFPERYFEGARRIGIPFARFQNGWVQVFPAVDASLQQRHRKLIEFCPALHLDASILAQLHQWTRILAENFGFVGVGSFEFLVDSDRVFLLEGVPRLNTAFPLWERVAGTSAVDWQLATLEDSSNVSAEELLNPRISQNPFGLSARLYAEDPYLQLPQPGLVYETPLKKQWSQPGVSGELSFPFERSERVSPSDSGMLGLLLVTSSDEKKLISRAQEFLGETWIAGSLQTNERFLAEILDHPWVKEGMFHASVLDEEFIPQMEPPPLIVQKVIEVCSLLACSERWIISERWVIPGRKSEGGEPTGGSFNFFGERLPALEWVSAPEFWSYQGGGGLSGRLVVDEAQRQVEVGVCVFPKSANSWLVRLGKWFLTVRKIDNKKNNNIRFGALVTGKVHAMLVRATALVPAHEPLVILESLGQFVPHCVPFPSTVIQWKVAAEEQVTSGQELADLKLLV